MSQIREDPITGRWVIIAPERNRRPHPAPTSSHPSPSHEKDCPFCEGNEDQTPPEEYAVREKGSEPDKPGWRIRVFPNKFPALDSSKSSSRHSRGNFCWMEGAGVHEVVVETPSHAQQMSDLHDSHLQEVLKTYQERIRNIEETSTCHYIQVFKNRGELAGASQSHTHSQIVATPLLSARIKDKIEIAEKFFQETQRCRICQIIKQESQEKDRLIQQNQHFCMIAPFASRFAYEMHVYPFRHSAYYREISEEELKSLSQIIKKSISTLKEKLFSPPFILILNQGPNPRMVWKNWRSIHKSYHWHIEIFPVLSPLAGFERGTGFYINPVSPEKAAEYFR
ncbi:galactose-1-phosphate uridylyltransferase [bacterium]|nr:galactose-1-phosphate uridylyltransferase [bacterium]